MKKIKFKSAAIALAALTVGFTSCSKDDNGVGDNTIESKPAFVTVSVKGNALANRAIVTDNKNGATIEDLTVFILGPANEILQAPVFISFANYDPNGDDTNKGNVEIATKTNAKRIYVVGNTGNLTTTKFAYPAVNTLAKLQEAYLDLADLYSTTAMWIEGHMTSDLAFTLQATSGDPLAKPAAIQMNLIPARVDVYVNNNMKGYDAADPTKSMVLTNIAFLNSAGKTSPVPYNAVAPYNYAPQVADITGAYYRSGLTDYGSITGLVPGTITYLNTLERTWVAGGTYLPTPPDDVMTTPANWKSSMQETFYVLPGGNDDRPKIVTVEGTLANSATKIYFPVHFNTSDTRNLALESGKHYTVTINLNGDATTGGGGGTDPEVPVVDAFVTVIVTVAQWDVVDPFVKEFK